MTWVLQKYGAPVFDRKLVIFLTLIGFGPDGSTREIATRATIPCGL